jgi:hypothetical protein
MKIQKQPSAIVIGAPKAGTTTLCDSLARHPDVYMYPKKETHFYNTYYHSRGLKWYYSLFKDAPNGKLIMEGTPDYAMSNHVHETIPRIKKNNPETKLIFMVRDPIERIESHYIQMLSDHRTIIDRQTAFEQWPEIINSSRYSNIMDQILEHFPIEQVFVIFLDEYSKNKRNTHKEAARFLNISTEPHALDKMEFKEHSHKRENQAMDGFLLSLLRKSKYYDRLNILLPKPLINISKKVLRKKIEVNDTLDKKTRHSLQKTLISDWMDFQLNHRK